MPDLSLIIPTKQRPRTFARALQTALDLPSSNLEIVVQNNGADAETRALVEAAADPRVVYRETEQVLPMTENWEVALGGVTGRYVTYMGDDDGALPGLVERVCAVFDAAPTLDVISWAPPDYGWPDAATTIRDRLIISNFEANRASIGMAIGSAELLRQIYRYERRFIAVPSIYHGSVRIEAIRRMQRKHGRYFSSALPDLYSGIINLVEAPGFFRLHLPGTIRGASGYSTGAAYANRVAGTAIRAEFEATNGARFGTWQPGLFAAGSEQMVVANSMLEAKALLFADSGPEFSFMGLVGDLISTLSLEHPSGYDAKVAEIRRLAALHRISLEQITFPAKPEALVPHSVGIEAVPGGLINICIDCAAAGVRDIVDAVRLADGFLPRLELVAEGTVIGRLPHLCGYPRSLDLLPGDRRTDCNAAVTVPQ